MVNISYLIKEPHTGEKLRLSDAYQEGNVDIPKIVNGLRKQGARAIKIRFEENSKGSHIDARC